MQKKITLESSKPAREYESKGRPVITGQPEALPAFARAARLDGKKVGVHAKDGQKTEGPSLSATRETVGTATHLEDKHDAATKVLREGVLGTDQGADAAIDRLPDRITGKKPKRAG